MREPKYSSQFKRDVRRMKARLRQQKRLEDIRKLETVALLLIDEKPLPACCADHPLKGNWSGFRNAHIEPDWLIIYKLYGDIVRFERTGRHTDLFDE